MATHDGQINKTKTKSSKFLSFREARDYVWKLNFKRKRDWGDMTRYCIAFRQLPQARGC